MTEIREHLWQPIEDLPADWESLGDTELHSLMTAWQEQAESMRRRQGIQRFPRSTAPGMGDRDRADRATL